MDNEAIKQALALDAEWKGRARQSWLILMDLAVWGNLSSSRLGIIARVRKRTLEVGEKLKSLTGDRNWIPHPRERLKNALASALHLNDSLNELARVAGELDNGADLGAFGANLAELRHLVQGLAPLELRWAQLLDSQYRDEQG
ncbi:MAG: hypothetical protein AABZ67_03945 [Pseudomonadota bacterium]